MKNKFKKVAISSTNIDKKVVEIARQCCEILSNQNVEVFLVKNFKEFDLLKGYKKYEDQTIAKKADLLISIGGDGTMLGCARKFGSKGLPLLGLNLGNLGFLADLAPKDVTLQLVNIIKGQYISDKRFFLKSTINTSNQSNIALNEIVIHSGAIAQMIEYELFVDEIFVYRQKADGLIVNSPTGSTAYSLSGRGPIMHPGVKAITLLPMFPHSLSASTLLVDQDSEIRIKMLKSKNIAKLSLDSHDSINLKNGDIISIKKADPELTLIHPRDHDFFSACRNKLGWSSEMIKTSEEL